MRRRGIVTIGMATEEDARPAGALRFADPSTSEFPRHIHPFNEPHNPRATGEQHGVRSMTGSLVPWGDHHPGDAWREMNAKRGVSDDKEGD